MSKIFLHLINMSISASYIVLAVLILRPLLKKAPKWIAPIFWGIVAVRLLCPFSFESIFSLIPSAQTVSPDIMMNASPSINSGIPIVNDIVNPIISGSFSPSLGDSANPLQIWIPVITSVWLGGVLAMLAYAVFSYVKILRKVRTAVLFENNIYLSENVASPFVLGIIKPKIYLPFNIDKKDTEHVIAHERSHIKRKDHLWKPLGFILLAVYWFNPLFWLAYVLLSRDIELACDEKVIKELDGTARADYSEALLNCSVNRRMISACPLAFGEIGIKKRIKSVLSYKKPAFWLLVAALVACTVVTVCFLTNPLSDDKRENVLSAWAGGYSNEKLLAAIEEYERKYTPFTNTDASYEVSFDVGFEIATCEVSRIAGVSESDPEFEMTYFFDWHDTVNHSGSNVIVTVIYPNFRVHEYPSQWSYLVRATDTDGNEHYFYFRVIHKKASSIVYASPYLSFIMDPSLVPTLEIKDNILYETDGDFTRRLGTVFEIVLNYSTFKDYFEFYSTDKDEELIKHLLENNSKAYEITLDSPEPGIDLYYIMEQKDGSTLIVYGHYENGTKSNFIRWIYKTERSVNAHSSDT